MTPISLSTLPVAVHPHGFGRYLAHVSSSLRRFIGSRSAAACVLLLIAPAMFAQAAHPPDQTETLKVQVRLVSLFVNVTDPLGAPVADLQKANFALTEDDQPQSIAYFEKQTSVPLSVVLAIDTSGSTRKDIGPERHGARDFAQALLTAKDQLALFEFNSDVRQVVPFTNNLHQVENGLNALGHGPATALYSAVLLAAQALQPRSGRKVLILVSDGDDTVGGTSFDEALAEAQRNDVMIYSLIDIPIEADAGRDTGGEHAMVVLSQETGGRSFYVSDDSPQNSLTSAFQKVAADLRTQYLLGYYPRRAPHPLNPLAGPPSEANEFHSIHITLQGNVPLAAPAGPLSHVSNPGRDSTTGLTPHYRNGYYRAPLEP
jgi:Ca-activated chloride channel family protein